MKLKAQTHTTRTYVIQTQPHLALKVMTFSLLFALSVALLTSCSQTASKTDSKGAESASSTEAKPQSNFDVVAYSGPTFTLPTPDGSTLTFTDLLGQGKPLVVNFWGTWCPPCRREMPEFVRIYKEYQPQGLQLVGVALRDTPQRVSAYTGKEGITWPMALGELETARAFGGISAVPTTIFYDSQGLELSRYVGPMSYEMFKERVVAALRHEQELASS